MLRVREVPFDRVCYCSEQASAASHQDFVALLGQEEGWIRLGESAQLLQVQLVVVANTEAGAIAQ